MGTSCELFGYSAQRGSSCALTHYSSHKGFSNGTNPLQSTYGVINYIFVYQKIAYYNNLLCPFLTKYNNLLCYSFEPNLKYQTFCFILLLIVIVTYCNIGFYSVMYNTCIPPFHIFSRTLSHYQNIIFHCHHFVYKHSFKHINFKLFHAIYMFLITPHVGILNNCFLSFFLFFKYPKNYDVTNISL